MTISLNEEQLSAEQRRVTRLGEEGYVEELDTEFHEYLEESKKTVEEAAVKWTAIGSGEGKDFKIDLINTWKTETPDTWHYNGKEFKIKTPFTLSTEDGPSIEPDSIEDTLNQRESTYGDFMSLSNIAQNLKDGLKVGNWRALSNDKKEALEMLMTKIARILNGDPEYIDNWHDAVAYMTLVKMRLGENE